MSLEISSVIPVIMKKLIRASPPSDEAPSLSLFHFTRVITENHAGSVIDYLSTS
jgi:hypothetical protein